MFLSNKHNQMKGINETRTTAQTITINKTQQRRFLFFFSSLIDSSKCLLPSSTRALAFDIYIHYHSFIINIHSFQYDQFEHLVLQRDKLNP